MSATIRDVAAAAGVSTATVSRAMHGDPGVRRATAARVLEAAERLHYAPSSAASRLAGRRGGHVTFVVGSSEVVSMAATLAAASASLMRHDLDAVLHVLDHDDASVAQHLRGRTDAVVISPRGRRALVGALQDSGLPTVLFGRRGDGMPAVVLDPASMGELAANHLVSLGHRRLAVLSPLPADDSSDCWEIEEGFCSAVARREPAIDVQRLILRRDDEHEAERVTASLLSLQCPRTALFTTSHNGTVGAARAYLRHGRLPGDGMALIGVGAEDLSDLLGISLVSAPVADIGDMVGEVVQGALRGHSPAGDVRLDPQLIVRGSTVQRVHGVGPLAAAEIAR